MFFGAFRTESQEPVLTESFDQKIYFRETDSHVDYSYRDNRTALTGLKSAIDRAVHDGALVSIEIQAWASPSGKTSYNKQLSQERAKGLVLWIIQNCTVDSGKILHSSEGIGWDQLKQELSLSDVPYRDRAIDIIENTPVWVFNSKGQIISSKRKELMDLNYGNSWKDMAVRFFPNIRCATIKVNTRRDSFRESRHETVQETERPVPSMEKSIPAENITAKEESGQRKAIENIQKENILAAGASISKETVRITERTYIREDSGVKEKTVYREEVRQIEKPVKKPSGPPATIAIKTNLLEDAALIPNIGAEFHLGKGWSISADWKYAWWNNRQKNQYWRVYGGEIGANKYFGKNAEMLRGHHVGVFGQLFTYDFCTNGQTGIIGGAAGGTLFDKANYGFGIEYGYSFRIARRLNLDLSIGAGFSGGEFQEYKRMDDCNVWLSGKQRFYWGPTKAEISLVWLLDINRNRKGGER